MAAPICAFFDYQFGRGIVLSVRFTAGEDLAGLDFDVALCLYRVTQEALTNERAGRGLGLRSIDERVRLMRGEAIVESSPGRGTTIVVRIPVQEVAPAAVGSGL